MAQRRRLGAGRQVEQEDGDEIPPALEMHDGAVDAEPRPRGGAGFEKIDAEIIDDGHAFAIGPVEIGVEHHPVLAVLRDLFRGRFGHFR